MRTHGTTSMYVHGGCRCDECRAAGTDQRRMVRHRAGGMAPHVRASLRLAAASRESRMWIGQAACAGTDPNLFFTAGSSRGEQYEEARAVCATCPVTAECLEFSESSPETREHGMWGGLGPDERRKLRRKQRVA